MGKIKFLLYLNSNLVLLLNMVIKYIKRVDEKALAEEALLSEELSDIERKAFELIIKHGRKGIFQNDLWKQLGINSREASRIVGKLVKKGLITRKPAVNRGRRTYLLIAVTEKRKRAVRIKREKLEARIDVTPFLDIPCMRCQYINRCYSGGFFDPTKCSHLDKWILEEPSRSKDRR